MIRDFDKLPLLPTVFGPANQVAYVVENVDAGLDGLTRMSYVENDQGLILEIVEWNAMPRPYFDGIKDLHKTCDKQQLVHEFKLADFTPKSLSWWRC